MSEFLITGLLFGLTAGISPGPLLALLINETLRHNIKAGIKVAIAPLLTDVPIILLCYLLVSRFVHAASFLAFISIAGAIYIAYLGYENLRSGSPEMELNTEQEKALQKGIIVNFTNPHPYLFWITVGVPIMLRAFGHAIIIGVGFLAAFYLFLVGSKIAISLLVSKSRHFLTGKYYRFTLKILGILLVGFAFLLLWDAFKLLK